MRRFAGGEIWPFCVTVTGRPATVSVAVREAVPGFADTTIVTVPFPEPLRVSVNHEGAPDVDHAHPSGAVTASTVVAPAAATVTVSAETV